MDIKILKKMSNIRMWLAEKLLSWAFDLTPWNDEGQKIRSYISAYYLEKIKELENYK